MSGPRTLRRRLRRAAPLLLLPVLAAGSAPARAGEEPAARAATPAADEAAVRDANRAVVEEFFAALEAMDIPRFLEVWAEDGVQEMPFSPAGFPRRLEGRDAIANQYRSLPENYRSMRFPREILPMEDPSRFVVRYTGSIERNGGGRYDNTYLGLFTVRDGKVAAFVEYFDPIVLRDAFGEALGENFNVERP